MEPRKRIILARLQPWERIIFALDVDDDRKAVGLVEQLAGRVDCFKIGLQRIFNMFRNGEWPEFSRFLRKVGAEIFIDIKLNDISNTVKAAAKEIVSLEPHPKFFNVHASAGVESMRAAVDASINWTIHTDTSAVTDVLAVTVLTSLGEYEAPHIFGNPSKTKVLELARDAKLAGVTGVICSPKELKLLREQRELDGMLMVTPGIRPEWAPADDQKRITTPREAILDGADYLVIGRPIQKPPAEVGSPAEAAVRIAEEIAAALEEKEEKEKRDGQKKD